MTERDMRAALRAACQRLDAIGGDRHAAAGAGIRRSVVPLVIGAGLALASCAGDPAPEYAVPAYGVPFDGGGAAAGSGGAGGTAAHGGAGGTAAHGGMGGAAGAGGGVAGGAAPAYGDFGGSGGAGGG